MTDEQLEVFFINNTDIFINNSIPWMVIKFLGWLIFKGLVWIAGQCENLYDISFGMIDFTSWSGVNQFVEDFKPLFVALMALSIFALGVMLILGKDKKPKIITNICIAVLCVTCSTVVFQQLNAITLDIKSGIDNIEVEGAEFNGVYDIVSDNLIDLVYLDQKIGMKNINYEKDSKDLPHPKITEENFKYIDYTEVLNYKSDYNWNENGNAEDILKKKLFVLSEGAGLDVYKVRDVYNGFGWNSTDDADICNEFYYRYEFAFFTAFIQVISIIIIHIAMSYKCVRIIWELVIARLLAYLYSAELSGGEKVGKLLIFIRDSYILLLVTTICIRVFYMMSAFIQENVDNAFVRGVLILFVAFCVIDGPNIVEKLLGMDVGLTSSTTRLIAAYGAVRSAANMAAMPFKFGYRQYEKRQLFSRMDNIKNKNDAPGEDEKPQENASERNGNIQSGPKDKNGGGQSDDNENNVKNNNEYNSQQVEDFENMQGSNGNNDNNDYSFMDDKNVVQHENKGFDTSFMDKDNNYEKKSNFVQKENKMNSNIFKKGEEK